jgi:ribosome-associated protein
MEGLDRERPQRRARPRRSPAAEPGLAAALARQAAALALTKKAEDVLILDLSGLASVCDYFVICHGDSDVQVKAIADGILDGLEGEGIRAWHSEGYRGRSWILLDYVDVVVHVFHRETRLFYRLEDLWADAPREAVS